MEIQSTVAHARSLLNLPTISMFHDDITYTILLQSRDRVKEFMRSDQGITSLPSLSCHGFLLLSHMPILSIGAQGCHLKSIIILIAYYSNLESSLGRRSFSYAHIFGHANQSPNSNIAAQQR